MSQARLMDGTALARRSTEQTAARAAALTARTGVTPCLATVLVGEDPASATYVRMKRNRCRAAGIDSRSVALPATTTTTELVRTIRELSADPAVHGILLQHPVGEHIDERAAFEAIAPEKDVDGVTFASFAAMSFGLPGFVSCTPGGILRLLDAYGVDPAGKRAVVVGRSAILGKPVGMLLPARDATVTCLADHAGAGRGGPDDHRDPPGADRGGGRTAVGGDGGLTPVGHGEAAGPATPPSGSP